MSKSGPHDECKRRERELEALVLGQANELARLGRELDDAEALLLRAHTGDDEYATLEADERLRLAADKIEEARVILRRHKRRKAFTTGLGMTGLDH